MIALQEATKAKLLPQEDPELETWECLTFLEKEFERSREDDSWLQVCSRAFVVWGDCDAWGRNWYAATADQGEGIEENLAMW